MLRAAAAGPISTKLTASSAVSQRHPSCPGGETGAGSPRRPPTTRARAFPGGVAETGRFEGSFRNPWSADPSSQLPRREASLSYPHGENEVGRWYPDPGAVVAPRGGRTGQVEAGLAGNAHPETGFLGGLSLPDRPYHRPLPPAQEGHCRANVGRYRAVSRRARVRTAGGLPPAGGPTWGRRGLSPRSIRRNQQWKASPRAEPIRPTADCSPFSGWRLR